MADVAPASAPQPQPIFAVQLVLLDDGRTLITPHPQFPVDSVERVGLGLRATQAAHLHFAQMPFPQAQSAIEPAPSGMQVQRNPKA